MPNEDEDEDEDEEEDEEDEDEDNFSPSPPNLDRTNSHGITVREGLTVWRVSEARLCDRTKSRCDEMVRRLKELGLNVGKPKLVFGVDEN